MEALPQALMILAGIGLFLYFLIRYFFLTLFVVWASEVVLLMLLAGLTIVYGILENNVGIILISFVLTGVGVGLLLLWRVAFQIWQEARMKRKEPGLRDASSGNGSSDKQRDNTGY